MESPGPPLCLFCLQVKSHILIFSRVLIYIFVILTPIMLLEDPLFSEMVLKITNVSNLAGNFLLFSNLFKMKFTILWHYFWFSRNSWQCFLLFYEQFGLYSQGSEWDPRNVRSQIENGTILIELRALALLFSDYRIEFCV